MPRHNEKTSLRGSQAEAVDRVIDCFRLEPILNQTMKNSKKILITSISSEIFIVRRGAKPSVTRAFCLDCRAQTEMLDLNAAVSLSRIGAREILRRIEAGALHSIETARGHLLVCRDSLEKFYE